MYSTYINTVYKSNKTIKKRQKSGKDTWLVPKTVESVRIKLMRCVEREMQGTYRDWCYKFLFLNYNLYTK